MIEQILTLVKEVNLNRNIQIACLPTTSSNNFPASNADGWIVGWGSYISLKSLRIYYLE
jgi:hypothetical protein